MPKYPSQFLLFIFILYGLSSCNSSKRLSGDRSTNITAVKFLGEYDIPLDLQYKNTTVGGLSGIDYDARRNQYYMISDDRSDRNPARFYTAKILFSDKGIDTVLFTNVTSLLQPNGKVYPNKTQDKFNVPDPEAMRVRIPRWTLHRL